MPTPRRSHHTRRWWRLLPCALLLFACDRVEDVFVKRSPGEKLFRKHCAECHGLDAAGNTPGYMGNSWADLRDNDWKYGGDAGSIENTVRQGVFAEMPGHPELSRAEMKQLIDYLLKLRGETRGNS